MFCGEKDRKRCGGRVRVRVCVSGGCMLYRVWKCSVCALTLADSRRKREGGIFNHTNERGRKRRREG